MNHVSLQYKNKVILSEIVLDKTARNWFTVTSEFRYYYWHQQHCRWQIQQSISTENILRVQCKRDITPWLIYWSYISFALSLQYIFRELLQDIVLWGLVNPYHVEYIETNITTHFLKISNTIPVVGSLFLEYKEPCVPHSQNNSCWWPGLSWIFQFQHQKG